MRDRVKSIMALQLVAIFILATMPIEAEEVEYFKIKVDKSGVIIRGHAYIWSEVACNGQTVTMEFSLIVAPKSTDWAHGEIWCVAGKKIDPGAEETLWGPAPPSKIGTIGPFAAPLGGTLTCVLTMSNDAVAHITKCGQ